MRDLRSIIASITEDISNVIHAGAGYCTEIDLYQDLGLEAITFVEPDEELFDIASGKFSDIPNVTVLQQAIGGETENRIYFKLSNKRFSSLLEPNQLLKFYPNLEVTRQSMQETTTLAALCDDILPPAKVGNHLLVLELQGEETAVVTNTAVDILHKFKWIVIRSSKELLYGTAAMNPGAEITRSLHDANFDVLRFDEDAPPFCNYLFNRNDAKIANQVLNTDNEELVQQVNTLQQEATQHLEETVQHQDRNTGLSKELETVMTDLGVARDQITDLSDARQQLQQQILDLKETCLSTQVELNETQAQRQVLVTEKSIQQQRIDELKESQLAASTELSESLDELKEANHALRINNKLVAKTDADLRDLQARYQGVVENQQQQHALLLELQQKLVQAANFYKQLDIQDRDIEGDIFSHDVETTPDTPDQDDVD